jgi:hypothetical protein
MKRIQNFAISLIGIIVLSFGFSGCAKNAVEVKPMDVNQTVKDEHQKYNCSQLEQKYAFLDGKLKRNGEQLNNESFKDNMIVGYGWLLWGVPYLLLGGNEENEKAYAQLLGLKEYLQELMIGKNCNLEQDILKVRKEITINNQDNY